MRQRNCRVPAGEGDQRFSNSYCCQSISQVIRTLRVELREFQQEDWRQNSAPISSSGNVCALHANTHSHSSQKPLLLLGTLKVKAGEAPSSPPQGSSPCCRASWAVFCLWIFCLTIPAFQKPSKLFWLPMNLSSPQLPKVIKFLSWWYSS